MAGSQATLVESFGQGTDTVETTTATFNLPTNIEHLIYTGTGTFTGIGNGLDNQITGGDGNDILSGGDGNDVLTGGNGADQFRYLGGETGLDRIYDFESGADKIMLADTGFVHTATIDVVQGSAPVAESENSTFLYDPTTGLLSYDADGKDVGAAVLLAQLNMALTLDVADFGFF